MQFIVKKNEVCVNSEFISTGVDVLPETLCCLAYSKNILSFRICCIPDTSTNVTTTTFFTEREYQGLHTQLKAGDSAMLTCFQCSSRILHRDIQTRYISPSVDLSDIFCHRDTNPMEFEKANFSKFNSNSAIIQYNSGSISFPRFPAENLDLLEDDSIFYCRRCLAWLGVRAQENSGILHFWDDTVKLVSTCNDFTQEQISEYIFHNLIRKTIVECLFPICNILLKNTDHSEHDSIFISILDRNLIVLEYAPETGLKETTYLKVIFEILNAKNAEEKHVIHGTEIVSKPTFLYVCKSLLSQRDEGSDNENIALLRTSYS